MGVERKRGSGEMQKGERREEKGKGKARETGGKKKERGEGEREGRGTGGSDRIGDGMKSRGKRKCVSAQRNNSSRCEERYNEKR
jgi:hypothetical protein